MRHGEKDDTLYIKHDKKKIFNIGCALNFQIKQFKYVSES